MLLYDKLNKVLTSIDFSKTAYAKHKLELYDSITNSSLMMDIKFTGEKESSLVYKYCEKELEYMISEDKDKSIIEEFKQTVKHSLIKEKSIFTKLFVRDYLTNVAKIPGLGLKNTLTAGILFRDFASEKLKKDKDFALNMLKLDGRVLPYMDASFKNNAEIINLALETDTSPLMESFLKCNSNFRKNPHFALKFFEGLRRNNKNMSVDTICKTFLARSILKTDCRKEIVGNVEPNVYVKVNGKIEWIGEDYLNRYYQAFSKMFSKDEVHNWIRNRDFLIGISKLDQRYTDHVTEILLAHALLDELIAEKDVETGIQKVKK